MAGGQRAAFSWRAEIVGGIATFLTMSYILVVNPLILSETGMEKGALFTTTLLAAVLGTLLIGAWARVPFAMAPGMGLNALFAYTLVLGEKVSWQTALGVVFLSGVFFLLLTVLGVRQRIVQGIPVTLRIASAGGIGLFIAFIGWSKMGLIVDDPNTLLTLGPFTQKVICGLFGLLVTVVWYVRRWPGAVLVGIVASCVLAAWWGMIGAPEAWIAMPPSPKPLMFELDIAGAFRWSLAASIFSFMFVDLFDSIGTLVACSYEAGLVAEDGSIPRINRMLSADALATIAGAVLGTSTTTAYIESGAGIAAGARTGWANVVTALCFLVALFFFPVMKEVPGFATSSALVFVGILMFREVRRVPFDDLQEAVPAFLTMTLMPLTFSISMGLTFGFLSYLAMRMLTGRTREVSLVLWVIGGLSLINLLLVAKVI